MADRYTFSPGAMLARRNGKAIIFQQRLDRTIERLRIPFVQKSRLRRLIGVGGYTPTILLSDVTARVAATDILAEVATAHFEGNIPEQVCRYHLTFADDIGLSSDRAPAFRLRALRRKVDKALRALGLNAIAVIEVQPLLNYAIEGRGRTLMLHAHALAWGGPSRRNYRKALKSLNPSRSWQNHFGAKPIYSRRLKQGAEDAHLIASYISKLPYDAKRRRPYGKGTDEFRFAPAQKGYPDRLALRIAEGLSHYSIFDAVFGVREGKHVRKEWKKRLLEWHHLRSAQDREAKHFDVARLWCKVRKKAGPSTYQPFNIQ